MGTLEKPLKSYIGIAFILLVLTITMASHIYFKYIKDWELEVIPVEESTEEET